jgi:hypothetical protein
MRSLPHKSCHSSSARYVRFPACFAQRSWLTGLNCVKSGPGWVARSRCISIPTRERLGRPQRATRAMRTLDRERAGPAGWAGCECRRPHRPFDHSGSSRAASRDDKLRVALSRAEGRVEDMSRSGTGRDRSGESEARCQRSVGGGPGSPTRAPGGGSRACDPNAAPACRQGPRAASARKMGRTRRTVGMGGRSHIVRNAGRHQSARDPLARLECLRSYGFERPPSACSREPSTSTSTRCGERITLNSRGWPRTERLGTPTRLPRWGPAPPSTPGSPARGLCAGGVARIRLFAVRQAHGDAELCRRVADRTATAHADSPIEVARTVPANGSNAVPRRIVSREKTSRGVLKSQM